MNILFLGDSITDCDHCFSPDNLGCGYVKYYNELLHDSFYQIVNGGSDGFTFPRILKKWENMYADQRWDTVFILGGINEAGYSMELTAGSTTHTFTDCQTMDAIPGEARQYLETSATAFQKLLSSLVSHNVRNVIVMEPFLFETPAYLLSWKPVLQSIQAMIRNCIAACTTTARSEESSSEHPQTTVVFLSLQDFFHQLSIVYGDPMLSEDGIHLTDFGHRKLAEYLKRKTPLLLT